MKVNFRHILEINYWLLLEGLIVGTFAFGSIYGFGLLNVTNDNWIMSGYDESDIIQHYAGWCAFRNSGWHFPIGLADNMGGGTYITFTDSIPWLAIFFKLILQIINYNGVFQYFGLYALVCYILQAIATGLIVSRKSKNLLFIGICMALLCFSPILMERSLRHTALGSQWLILFSMYFYLKFRDSGYSNFPFEYAVLALLAVGIHPYFLPLILIFSLLSFLSAIFYKTNIKKSFNGFIGSLVLPVIGGYIIGALGAGVRASRSGYGYYSMNLNAILNPKSCGGYDWSVFFKIHPQILGNYDGFNYLGLGYFLLILLAIFSLIILSPHWEKKNGPDIVSYVIAAIFMTAFAVSNTVTFNNEILAKIPLPQFLLKLCGIFRASSRIFYFTYYSLVIFSIYRIMDFVKEFDLHFKSQGKTFGKLRIPAICLTIGFIFLAQMVDLNHVRLQKQSAMRNKLSYQSILSDTRLKKAITGKKYLISEQGDRSLAVLAAQNHLATSFSVANSGSYYVEAKKANKILNDFYWGRHPDDIVIAFKSKQTARKLYQNDRIKDTCKYYETKGHALIIAETESTVMKRGANEYMASSLTDKNWTNGISNGKNIILFRYSDDLLDLLKNNARYVNNYDKMSPIIKYDYDRSWIRVTIADDAHDYSFPTVIYLEK